MSQRSDLFDRIKTVFKFLFGVPLTILSFYFIGLILFQGKTEISANISSLRLLPLVSGFVLLTIFFLLRSIIWWKIIKKQGYVVPGKKALFLLSKSELRRYIPGSILAFATRVTVFKKEDIPTRVIIKSLGIEAIIFIISSFAVSIPAVIYLWQTAASSVIFSYLSVEAIKLFLFVLFTSGAICGYFIFKKYRLLGPRTFNFFKNYKNVFLLSLLSWIFFGLGNLLVASSITYMDAYKIIPISSFFVLSWLVGYLSFIAPMGLGVREALVIYILSLFTTISLATVVAVFLRVVLILSEMITVFLTYIFYKTKKVMLSVHISVLFFSVISYITYFTYVTFQKHDNFFTGRFDLGNMDQTVWNTLHGRIFTLTNPDGINIISRLGIHADFILVLLAPFYFIWESPKMLLFIQSAVLGLGGIFVYTLAMKVIKDKNISLALSISYLLNPFVEKQNLYDFHSITLSTTFLLGTFFFLISKKYKLFVLFLALSVLTKENIFLVSAMFGLYLYLQQKRVAGVLLFTASLMSFYILVSQVIPAFRGGEHFALSYFQEFGDSPSSIISNLLFNPDKLLPLFISVRAITYLYSLLFPLGFLSLLSPLYLVFAAPDLFINIASKNANFTDMTFHYAAAIIPFLYVSAIFGIKRILSRKSKLISVRNLFYFILLTSFLSAWIYGPLPGSNHPEIKMFTNTLKEGREIRQFISKIPQNLSVSASNNLGAHLSHREKIYSIPNQMKEADMVLFLLNDDYAQPSTVDQLRFVRDLEYNENYTEVMRLGDFVAFKRK